MGLPRGRCIIYYYFWRQMRIRLVYFLFVVICIGAGCANITSPTGGKKDTRPPKLVELWPADSQMNQRVKRIELYFDEYVNVSDVGKEMALSPMLQIDPTVTSIGKHVIIKIADTLLEDNTTYRLSLGNAIKDVHEGNPFAGYTYTFSTGLYFDSLQLSGRYVDAGTGLPDVENVLIALYGANDNDSAVVRRKPKYITRADAAGNFTFKGLPKRSFRIYAMKDANNNMMYDGGGEMIAFLDHNVMPGDTGDINLRLFAEANDTGGAKKGGMSDSKFGAGRGAKAEDHVGYSVNVDTSNSGNRTFDLNLPITITFSKRTEINAAKIALSYDTLGQSERAEIQVDVDTSGKKVKIYTDWHENTVYTLKLPKGFAKDSAGNDLLPSHYTFRTREDEDYGKITVHVPTKFKSGAEQQYLLRVIGEPDTVYLKQVTDTMVKLTRLKPAKYTFALIVDKNKNGKWDTGDLFAKKQPEVVIPDNNTLVLKAGWENTVDFEEQSTNRKGGLRGENKPKQ
jgi:hypothetical protein